MQQGRQEPQKRHFFNRLFKSAVCFVVACGLFATLPSLPSPLLAQEQPNAADGITLDFEDVEIRSLIRYMAEITGRNFIVDNQITGKVTIVNPSPLSTSEAFDIFESLLYGAGYAIVPSGSVDRIIPLAEAGKEPISVLSSGERSNRPASFVTKNIKLRYVHVNSLLPIIRPLLSKTATLGAFVPGNMIVLTETFGNIERIQDVIRQLDTISGAGAIKLIPLTHADAVQVAAILERIFTEDAKTGSNDANSEGKRQVQIIPESATNTLIVVADVAEMRQIENLVDNLDVDNTDKVKALEIVYLKNADAPDLASVINKMLEKTSEESTSEGGEAKQKTALRILSTFKGPVSVVADESTNSLILSADPEDMAILKSVIDQLDIRRLQVYVEALVMEVSSQIADQFGVEWRTASNFGNNSGIVPFGGSTFGNGINALSTNPLNLPTGFSFGLAGSNITFRGQEFANIGLLVRALKSDTNINILSTPQLLTLDNQEAEIIVGDNVPFVTGTYSNDSGSSNPFQTIERKDIGLTLRMTPQISENGFIRMDIYQEFSSVAENRGEAADLVTRKRSIKTAVVVPDQQMIVLGGLIRDDVTETNQQIPCLAGIFGAGELFKNTSVTNQKTNLMVFIKPHIINTYGDIEAITHSKYTQIREHQTAKRRKGSVMVERITPDESSIVPRELRDGVRERNIPQQTTRPRAVEPVSVPLRRAPEPQRAQTPTPVTPAPAEKPVTPKTEEAPRTDPFVDYNPTKEATPSKVTPSTSAEKPAQAAQPLRLTPPPPAPVQPQKPLKLTPIEPVPTEIETPKIVPETPEIQLKKPEVTAPAIRLQAPPAPVSAPKLPPIALEKPAEAESLREIEDAVVDTSALILKAPKTVDSFTLNKPEATAPTPLIPLKKPAPLKKPEPVINEEGTDVPARLAAIAAPDAGTEVDELAPTNTLPQPEWSPESLSFPLPISYIGFEGDSILMNSYYRSTLDNVAARLKDQTRLMIEVRGYAPYDKGTEGRKRALARAVAVRNYLIAAGLPAGQIETYASLSDDADMLRANRVDVLRVR